MAKGIDFAFGNGLTVAGAKAAGVTFVCRYLSYLPNGKVINRAELVNWLSGGVEVVLNWEFTGIEKSFAQGVADAREAQRQAAALGHPDAPIIFSLDVDPHSAGVVPAAMDYMKGAGSVIPWNRRGVYGGYKWVKAYLDGNHGKYAWQTYAWSGGAWDSRAQLRQVQNGIRIGPCECDLDRSMATDYGQIPRPKVTPDPTPPPPTGPPVKHIADGTQTLAYMAKTRRTTVSHLVGLSMAQLDAAGVDALLLYLAGGKWTFGRNSGARLNMPKGLVYYTSR